jgi:hypothetical protein
MEDTFFVVCTLKNGIKIPRELSHLRWFRISRGLYFIEHSKQDYDTIIKSKHISIDRSAFFDDLFPRRDTELFLTYYAD